MLDCVVLLDKYYAMGSDIQNVDQDCMEEFLSIDLNDTYENFEDLYEDMNKFQTNKTFFEQKINLRLYKIIAFTYLNEMKK